MLPNANFKWKQLPLVLVWRKQPGETEEVELEEFNATNCASLFEEALRNNEVFTLVLVNQRILYLGI